MDAFGVVSLIIGIIGVISGVIGIFVSAIYNKKLTILKKELITIDWHDMKNASDEMAMSVRKKNFLPDIIFTPDIKCGAVAHMMESELSKAKAIRIPILVGILVWNDEKSISIPPQTFDKYVKTDKWTSHIPKELYSNPGKKILIVDDFCKSGDLVQKLREFLINRGIPKANIEVACIIATKIARDTTALPDYYWKETNSSDFYFPWGPGR